MERIAMSINENLEVAVGQEIAISRVFDAPRDLVFDAWTEPDRLMEWWGPRGFTCPHSTIDLSVGGICHNCMRSPEGVDYWSKGIYKEIIRPEKLVYSDSFADGEGNIVPASYYGMPGEWPEESLIIITFEEHDGQTVFTLHHQGIPAGENRDMCKEGWSQSLDKLEEYLADEV
jgi:uncharacterized protein YndB with AHSA1/START domain